MDVFRTVMGALGCINNLFTLIEKNNNQAKSLSRGLKSIKIDFETMSNLRPIQGKQLLLQPARMQLLLQELACDIEDFIQDLWVPDTCGAFILSATGMDPRPELIECTKEFRTRIKVLSEELKSSQSTTSAGSATPILCPSSARSPSYAPEKDLVGIAKPKQEIVDLLSPREGALKVISILGCSGLGKTALASALYQDDVVTKDFDYKSWVVASDPSPDDIVEKMHQHLLPAAPGWGSTFQALQHTIEQIRQQLRRVAGRGSTSEALQHFSKEKRYLVFVDDVKRGEIKWKHIEKAFRGNNMGSRIILTTRVSSVAAACSSGSYIYTMQCLGEKESEELFWTKAKGYPERHAKLPKRPEDIVLKCGGLPLALISAGEYLSEMGMGLNGHYEDLGKELGGYLIGEENAFAKMKMSLIQCYEKLPNYNHMICLLYISLFPRGHQINKKSLVRKLMAEGLVFIENRPPEELVAKDVHKCLDELVDQSMIEKVLFRNKSKIDVERWKFHSIMLEFTIKNAVSTNYMSLIRDDKLETNDSGRVRRLTVHSTPPEGYSGVKNIILSSVRSLTIFPSGNLDFRSCKMMRILDLEGCNWLNMIYSDAVSTKEKGKSYLEAICDLVFLKYLSLRKTGITTLPKAVKNLKCLETLDIRETGVETLPLQVIILPQLAFLFGKFEVPKLSSRDSKVLEMFLKKESKLHTLAGVVINETKGFETIILHARRLEKVKVWFKVNSSVALAAILVSSLQERSKDLNSLSLDSVSIDFNGLSYDFLGSLEAACIISSIKLWGKLESLPESAMLSQLNNLRKLHLFSTGLSIAVLAILQNLQYLEYLKLAEDKNGSWNGNFVVTNDGFPSLHLLCLEAPKLPKLKFEQGSMASLNSLQLLCPGSPAKAENISHLAKLNEVILHHSATDSTVKAWKDAAKLHANKPYVKKQPEPKTNAP